MLLRSILLVFGVLLYTKTAFADVQPFAPQHLRIYVSAPKSATSKASKDKKPALLDSDAWKGFCTNLAKNMVVDEKSSFTGGFFQSYGCYLNKKLISGVGAKGKETGWDVRLSFKKDGSSISLTNTPRAVAGEKKKPKAQTVVSIDLAKMSPGEPVLIEGAFASSLASNFLDALPASMSISSDVVLGKPSTPLKVSNLSTPYKNVIVYELYRDAKDKNLLKTNVVAEGSLQAAAETAAAPSYKIEIVDTIGVKPGSKLYVHNAEGPKASSASFLQALQKLLPASEASFDLNGYVGVVVGKSVSTGKKMLEDILSVGVKAEVRKGLFAGLRTSFETTPEVSEDAIFRNSETKKDEEVVESFSMIKFNFGWSFDLGFATKGAIPFFRLDVIPRLAVWSVDAALIAETPVQDESEFMDLKISSAIALGIEAGLETHFKPCFFRLRFGYDTSVSDSKAGITVISYGLDAFIRGFELGKTKNRIDFIASLSGEDYKLNQAKEMPTVVDSSADIDVGFVSSTFSLGATYSW